MTGIADFGQPLGFGEGYIAPANHTTYAAIAHLRREQAMRDYVTELGRLPLNEALQVGVPLDAFFVPEDARRCRDFLHRMAGDGYRGSSTLRQYDPTNVSRAFQDMTPDAYEGNVFAYSVLRSTLEGGLGVRVQDMAPFTTRTSPPTNDWGWSVRGYRLTDGQEYTEPFGHARSRLFHRAGHMGLRLMAALDSVGGRHLLERLYNSIDRGRDMLKRGALPGVESLPYRDHDNLPLYLCVDGLIRIGANGAALPPSFPYEQRRLTELGQYATASGQLQFESALPRLAAYARAA